MAERRIVVQLHRKGKVLWTRRFARLDTALPRVAGLMAVMDLQPKDVVEFSHINGLYIGVFKVRVNGFIGEFPWED